MKRGSTELRNLETHRMPLRETTSLCTLEGKGLAVGRRVGRFVGLWMDLAWREL